MNEARKVYSAFMMALGALLPSAIALADPPVSPAMFAKYNTYNQNDGRPGHNASCFNDPAQMPPGQDQSSCSVSAVPGATGVTTITVKNGRPFAEFFDTGYATFVTAVGGNAICRETAISFPNATDISSTVRCVKPDGSPVSTPISWFYRADSVGFTQFGYHNRNFAYARFNRGSPTQLVNAESFNSYDVSPGGITNQKLGTGRYKVTFVGAGTNASEGVDPNLRLGNVQALPTCSSDTSAECRRAHCRIASQATSATATVVEVNCYSGGVARDVDFRVYAGAESHSSQVVPDETVTIFQGSQYGWARVPQLLPGNPCLGTTSFAHKNYHTTVDSSTPLELLVCPRSNGVYRVDFDSHGGFYKTDTVSAIITPLKANTYCNLGPVSCGSSTCGGGQNVYLDVLCFDNAGSASNTAFNLSMIYH